MSIVVEDGSGIANANAYVSVDDCSAYCAARGLTFAASPTAEGEQAIVRASKAIDAQYGSRFPGYRTNGRDQGMQWPRTDAVDSEDEEIGTDEIPQEIIDAVCEAAVRELATPGSMMPDLERGGRIQSIQAGSVAITYGGNAEAVTTYQIIDGILAPLLGAPVASFVGRAIRG